MTCEIKPDYFPSELAYYLKNSFFFFFRLQEIMKIKRNRCSVATNISYAKQYSGEQRVLYVELSVKQNTLNNIKYSQVLGESFIYLCLTTQLKMLSSYDL